jgi:hypothetical protein
VSAADGPSVKDPMCNMVVVSRCCFGWGSMCSLLFSNFCFFGQVPVWDESDEQVKIGGIELKRFVTLSGIITNLLSGGETSLDLEVVATVLLLLPSFSAPRDFFAMLYDRYDLKRISNATNFCREQKQLKILAILLYWLRSEFAGCDVSGSLVDTISEFIEEVILVGSKPIVGVAMKIKV